MWHGSATSTRSTDLAARLGDPLFSANVSGPLEQYRALVDDYRRRWVDVRPRPGRRARRCRLGRPPRAPRLAAAVEEFRPSYEAFQASPGPSACRRSSRRWRTPSPAARTSSAARSRCSSRSTATTTAFGHEVQHIGGIGSLDDPVRRRSIELFAAEVLPVHPRRRSRTGCGRPRPDRRSPNRPEPPTHRTRPPGGTHDHHRHRPRPGLGGADVIRRSPHLGTEILGLDLDRRSTTPTATALRALCDDPQGARVPRRRPDARPARRRRCASSTSRSTTRPRCATPSTRLVYPYEVRTTGKASRWHVGGLWRDPVFSIESLVYEVVPEIGGDTIWADLQAAYDDLSEPFKELVGSVGVRYDGNADTTPRAPRAHRVADTTEHPLVLRQPAQRPQGPVPEHVGRSASPASARPRAGAAATS